MAAMSISRNEAARAWGRVALLSFGGPAGQIAVMHRIIVEEKRWVSDARFLHALNYCMLLPGPEAMQLAAYLGWLLHGVRGGLTAGLLFILPGVVSIMALSVIYASYGSVGIVAAVFFGLKAGVIAIVLDAFLRLSRRALAATRLKLVAGAAFIAIFFFAAPFPLIVLAAGVVGLALSPSAAKLDLAPADQLSRPPPQWRRTMLTAALWLAIWLAPVVAVIAVAGRGSVYAQIGLFFAQTALVTFGGAYSVLAYVAQHAVEAKHWLSATEMLDGLGLAETTPGPLIMVLQFVGFLAGARAPGALPPLAAGALGGLMATWVTFAPCFLWVFAGAPHIETLRGVRRLDGALSAVTAAVVGIVLNLSVWFAVHAAFARVTPVRGYGLHFDAPMPASLDPVFAGLALAAVVALFGLRLSMPVTLAAAAAAGVLLHLAGIATAV